MELTKSDIDSLICAVDFFTYNAESPTVRDRSKALLAKLRTLKETAPEA